MSPKIATVAEFYAHALAIEREAAMRYLQFADQMNKVRVRVHLSLHANETSALSHWQIPEAHFLEAWSDARAYDGDKELGMMPVTLELKPGESKTIDVKRKAYVTRTVRLDGTKSRVVIGLVSNAVAAKRKGMSQAEQEAAADRAAEVQAETVVLEESEEPGSIPEVKDTAEKPGPKGKKGKAAAALPGDEEIAPAAKKKTSSSVIRYPAAEPKAAPAVQVVVPASAPASQPVPPPKPTISAAERAVMSEGAPLPRNRKPRVLDEPAQASAGGQ